MPARKIIITAPGDYITRDGRRVSIHTVYDGPIPYTFACKGSIWRMYRGKERPRGHQIWCRTGHLNVVGESPMDIVGPWPGFRFEYYADKPRTEQA